MTTLAERLGIDTADWMSHPDRNCASPADSTAADIQAHADRWFAAEPWGESKQARRVEAAARRLCAGCPVAATCAAWAIPQTDLLGVWGGITAQGRARLRKKAAA